MAGECAILNNPDTSNDTPNSTETFPTTDTLLWEVLPSLHLNIVQTASLCGVSVRQLGYWTKQGYVSAVGRGARRMYGMNALRRILAIKRAMTNGASLRQALRMLPEQGATASPALTTTPYSFPALTGANVFPASHALTQEDETTLAAELLALFAANRGTRDNASGLAVKVGRSADDIQTVAEALSAQGLLRQTSARGTTVFQQVGTDGP